MRTTWPLVSVMLHSDSLGLLAIHDAGMPFLSRFQKTRFACFSVGAPYQISFSVGTLSRTRFPARPPDFLNGQERLAEPASADRGTEPALRLPARLVDGPLRTGECRPDLR